MKDTYRAHIRADFLLVVSFILVMLQHLPQLARTLPKINIEASHVRLYIVTSSAHMYKLLHMFCLNKRIQLINLVLFY